MITVTAKIKDVSLAPYLEQRAGLHQKVLRKLFVAIYCKKENPNVAYNRLAAQFGIFAVEINSLRKETEAIYKGWQASLVTRIASQEHKLNELATKLDMTTNRARAQQWRRKLYRYQQKLTALQAELAGGVPHICFGSRKLFYAQYHLSQNAFCNHAEWQAAWQTARSDAFYLAGRGLEHSGNNACMLEVTDVSPNALEVILHLRKKNNEIAGKKAKVKTPDFIPIPVRFTYNHRAILAALDEKRPLSYRFLQEDGVWKVQVMVDLSAIPLVTDVKYGSIGVDQNPLCIAASLIKPDGNATDSYLYKLTQGHQSAHQAEYELSQVVCALVDLAATTRRPIVIEKLDFPQIQRELKGRGLNRLISRFKHRLFHKLLFSRAAKFGVEIIEVNPAFSSVIGWLKFGYGYGLNRHQAAALAIGRRVLRPSGKRFSERIRVRLTPGHPAARQLSKDASAKPVRKRSEHDWTGWGRLRKLLARKPSKSARVGTAKRSAVSRPTAEKQGPSPYPRGRVATPPVMDASLEGSRDPSVNRRGIVQAPA